MSVQYQSGEDVRLGDIVDVGHGRGPTARVVVIIPTEEALDGFDAKERAYLGKGIVLQDDYLVGLLHLDELDDHYLLIRRA